MPAHTDHWLELTEFVHCEPSALAFRALVALLDTWPADDQAAAIDYADKLLMPFGLPNGPGARRSRRAPCRRLGR